MFRTIQVVLTANIASYRAQMYAAAAATKDFAREVTEVGARTDATTRQALTTAGRVAVVTGGALAAGFVLSTRQAMAFERELRNVNSIAHMSERQLGSTGESLLQLSRTVPQSATTLAKGLYDIASSGFQGARGLHVLQVAAVAASAGLTDTATAARAITAVLNAYGLSAGRANDVSDILFQTVNLGVLSFEQLAGTVSDFVGSAAAAGVPIEDAAAALATMTLSGLTADEAGVSLNRTLQALIDPSEAMAQLLRTLGYESGIAALDALKLEGTMELLRTATGGNIETLVQLFPEIRAARGALALMAADGQTYSRVADEITDANGRAGAAQAAFNEQAKSTSFQLEVAKNNVVAFAIQVGQMFLPAVRGAAGFAGDLADGMSALGPAGRTVVTVTALVTAGVLTTGGALLLLAPRIVATKALLADLALTAPRTASAIGMVGTVASRALPVMAVATTVLSLYASEKAKVRQRTEELTQALTEEREGVSESTDAWITKKLVENDLVSTAQRLGLNIADVVDAVKGEKDAVDSLNASLQRFQSLVDAAPDALNMDALDDPVGHEKRMQTVRDVQAVREAVGALAGNYRDAASKDRQLAAAQKATGAATRGQSKEMAELDKRLGGAAAATKGLTEEQRELFNAVQGFIDPAGLLSEIESGVERQRKRTSSATESAVRRQLDLEAAVLGVTRAERELIVAEERLTELRSGPDPRVIADAERDLAEAVRTYERAVLSAADAKAALDALRRGPSGDTLERAELDDRRADIAVIRAREEADRTEARIELLKEAGADEQTLADATLDHEEAMIALREAELRAGDAQERLNDLRDGAAPRELADAERALADAHEAEAEAARAVADRTVELDRARNPDLTKDLAEAELAYREALLAVRQAQEAVAETQRRGVQASEEFSGGIRRAEATLAQFEQALRDEIAAQIAWEHNLVTIAARGGNTVAEEFRKLGRDHAGIVSQMASATDAEFSRMAELMKTKTELGSYEHYTALERGLAIANAVMQSGMKATAETIAKELNLSVEQVKEIAAKYGIVLAEGLKPVWIETGGSLSDEVKTIQEIYGLAKGGVIGGPESHVAQIAPAGAWRLWAEPETGGEAYIPLAEAKRTRSTKVLREVARTFGYELAEFAGGGFRGEADVPTPPTFDMFGPKLSHYSSEFVDVAYDTARSVVRAWTEQTEKASGVPADVNTIGQGWRSIVGFLNTQNVPHTVTSTTGGRHVRGSLHYAGKAVDLVSADMRRIFDTLATARNSLAELFYTPAGYSVKNSAVVRPPIAAAGHYDHVHAATYDDGGILPPGLTLARNMTGTNEYVSRAPSLVIDGPLCTIEVYTSARVDERAFKAAVRDAVEPALDRFAAELGAELQGDGR